MQKLYNNVDIISFNFKKHHGTNGIKNQVALRQPHACCSLFCNTHLKVKGPLIPWPLVVEFTRNRSGVLQLLFQKALSWTATWSSYARSLETKRIRHITTDSLYSVHDMFTQGHHTKNNTGGLGGRRKGISSFSHLHSNSLL